jgi:nucleotide-binding universal stress UspA family protein
MEKRILIAVDDSRHSKNALRYAVQMSTLVENLKCDLFHIQPMISSFLREEARRDGQARKQLNRLQQANEKAALELVGVCRDEMVGLGIAPEKIECLTRKRKLGFAKDIIEFAQKKRYDAIVAGRRGLSRLEKLYTGSVTANILEQAQVIPVWLVNGKTAAGDILVAIDGSEACLRVIDHVGFMLAKSPGARVTLLHVAGASGNRCQSGSGGDPDQELAEIIARGEKACIDLFCGQARKQFEEAGLPAERVKLEVVKGGRKAGKAILAFAEKKRFGTIVVGRRGIDKAFFMGSVSRYLVDKVTRGALWIVP